MEPTIKAGRVFGIEINLAYSWFLIFVFATMLMALQFGEHFPDWPSSQQFFWGLATSALFFASILGHEVAHGLVALYHKIRVHSITLHILGGFARLHRPARTPFEEFTIAAAGPVSSLLFASCFAAVWFFSADYFPAISLLASRLAWINLILGIFNTLPTFPLDGGLVLRSLFWQRTGQYTAATRYTAYIGQALAVSFMLLGVGLLMTLGMIGIWFMVIGYNFIASSRLHLKEVRLKEQLNAYKVGDIALQQLPQVSSNQSVREVLDNYLLVSQPSCFLVVDENVVAGLVLPERLNNSEKPLNEDLPISEIMTPVSSLEVIDLNTNVVSALELMDCTETTQLPVVQDQQLQGFINREALVAFITSHFEYGKQPRTAS